MIYGYCRISRATQEIARQITNITKAYPEAKIYKEAFTGTKVQGRIEWNNLYKRVKKGDVIVFDSVSRMSRNATEGVKQYMELFDRGVELIFLKEPHINTATYKRQIQDTNLPNTDNKVVNLILEGVTKALKELAREQIQIAFDQAEKEVKDLQKRTSEGMLEAREKGSRIGTEKGRKLVTKKSIEKKREILKYAKDFGGALIDKDVIKLLDINRNTYYKYKKELVEELQEKPLQELKKELKEKYEIIKEKENNLEN